MNGDERIDGVKDGIGLMGEVRERKEEFSGRKEGERRTDEVTNKRTEKDKLVRKTDTDRHR